MPRRNPFSSSSRVDKPLPPPTGRHFSAHPSSSAGNMIKKLSTTFRRKTSISPTNITATQQALGTPASPPLQPHASSHSSNHSSASARNSSINNRSKKDYAPQSPVLRSPKAHKGRAMTFSVGSKVDDPALRSGANGIPFFDRENAPPSNHASRSRPPTNPVHPVAVVRGKPAWMKSEDDEMPTQKMHPRQMSHQPSSNTPVVTVQKSSAKPPASDYVRHRNYSFDIDSTSTHNRRRPNNRDIFPSRRRWLIPLNQAPDRPVVFEPPADTKYERISRHRDRAEAKVLVSVCTYLEAEIDRAEQQVSAAESCCCMAPKQSQCQCMHRAHLSGCAERLRAMLGILEERYDTIENVYVKSEEYARAMGKFFQLTPSQYNRIVTSKDAPAAPPRKQQQNPKSQKTLTS